MKAFHLIQNRMLFKTREAGLKGNILLMQLDDAKLALLESLTLQCEAFFKQWTHSLMIIKQKGLSKLMIMYWIILKIILLLKIEEKLINMKLIKERKWEK